MKKFQFSLAKVKDYKELVFEREKSTLTRLQDNCRRLEIRIENIRRKRRGLDEELREKTMRGVVVAEIQSYRFQIDSLQKLIESLLEELDRMQRQVEAQMKKVVAAKREVSGMEKLEEKQLEEYRQEMNTVQQKEIAEFVETRIAAQSREEEC